MLSFHTYLLKYSLTPVILGLLITLSAGLFSCRPEESLPPIVTYLEPDPNTIFYSGDTIWVKAQVESEHLVTEVQLDLVNAVGTPISPQIRQYPKEDAFLFESFIALNDLQFTTGTHQLRLWVRDKASDKRKYQDIHLEGLPLKSAGYVIAEYVSTQSRALVWFDANLSEQRRDTLQGDHLALRHIPGNNMLYTCGKVLGPLEARSIPHFDLVWSVNAIPNPPAPYFNFLEVGLDRFLLTGFADGFIRVFRPNGWVEETILVKEGCIAARALLTDNYLLVDEVSRSSPVRYLSIYYYPSGSLFYRFSPGIETKGLFARAQDVLWIGNTGDGGAEVRKLVLEPGVSNTLLRSLEGEVDAAVLDHNQNIIFSMNKHLFKYDPSGNSLTQLPFSGSASVLFRDPVAKLLGVVGDSCFHLVSLETGVEMAKYPGNRHIFDACVLLKY